MDTILLTGASGFVGKALAIELMAQGKALKAVARNSPGQARLPAALPSFIADLSPHTDWRQALSSVSVLVHLAARVHITDAREAQSLAAFRHTNVAATLNLARQAAEAGVKRFVFVSSLKVNGENSLPGVPFTADDPVRPADAYARSKWEAEQGLWQLAKETGMEVVVLRPPLVYGPGVKANFKALLRYLDKGLPLPFARIDNKRSFIALDNLVDVIIISLAHPQAANQTFLASDGEDISTPDLLRGLAAAMGKKARLLPIPASVLGGGLGLLGQRAIAQRLCGTLQADIAKTRGLLAWTPRVNLKQALSQTAQDYLANR